MTNKVVLSTNNPGKVREITQILRNLPIELVASPPLNIEETGQTYLENALLKARYVVGLTAMSAIADDSGIEVDALGGAPGVRSARFAGLDATDAQNNAHLVRLLDGIDDRRARYRCVAVMVTPGGAYIQAEATCEGAISLKASGDGGFGYDPWFIPSGASTTMAQLSASEKDAISHRGKAFRLLATQIRELLQ